MSNPDINRWGLNLFWYYNWYDHKFHASNVQQDTMIYKLVYCFLFYGIFFPKTIFFNTRWIQQSKTMIQQHVTYQEKFFRRQERFDEFIHEFYNVRTRPRLRHFYYSHIWIFKYQNWLIINFYSAKPIYNKSFKLAKRLRIASYSRVLNPFPNKFAALAVCFTNIAPNPQYQF